MVLQGSDAGSLWWTTITTASWTRSCSTITATTTSTATTAATATASVVGPVCCCTCVASDRCIVRPVVASDRCIVRPVWLRTGVSLDPLSLSFMHYTTGHAHTILTVDLDGCVRAGWLRVRALHIDAAVGARCLILFCRTSCMVSNVLTQYSFGCRLVPARRTAMEHVCGCAVCR